MNDDSPSSSTPGGAGEPAPPPPPVVDPAATVMRPSEPQPPPGAFDNGDGPVSAAPTPSGSGVPAASAPDPAAGVATSSPTTGQPAPPFPGGFQGEPRDGGPVDPEFPTRASRAGATGAIVALGAGLLGAAVVISAVRSRSDGELDWSNFVVGLGATAVLLLIALVGTASARRVGGRAREEVVTWPGVVGILATAVMIAVAIDKDDDWVGYLVGGVMVALAAIGYLAARRAAFVVVAIAGLGLIYLVAIDDLVPDRLGEDHPMVLAAALIAAFVVVVTLLGWLLPSRAVSGVAVGVVGLVGLVGVMFSFVVVRYVGEFFGPMTGLAGVDMGADPPMDIPSDSGFGETDIWWVIAIAAVLVVLWALAAAITNHSGFTILAIALTAVLVPMATVALAVEQPTWWSAALASGGGILLLAAAWLARRRGRSVAQEI